jgi:hypothetical protein
MLLLAISAMVGIVKIDTSPIKENPAKIRQIKPGILFDFSLILMPQYSSSICRTLSFSSRQL